MFQLSLCIDQSIGATLWEYAENGSDRAIAIDWNDQANNRRYRAVPGEPVACLEQGCWARLSKDGTAEVEFLRRTMRDYLGQESSYALLSLLRALSRCPNTAFVREISVRNRRWWIGSLLNYADALASLATETTNALYSCVRRFFTESVAARRCRIVRSRRLTRAFLSSRKTTRI